MVANRGRFSTSMPRACTARGNLTKNGGHPHRTTNETAMPKLPAAGAPAVALTLAVMNPLSLHCRIACAPMRAERRCRQLAFRQRRAERRCRLAQPALRQCRARRCRVSQCVARRCRSQPMLCRLCPVRPGLIREKILMLLPEPLQCTL